MHRALFACLLGCVAAGAFAAPAAAAERPRVDVAFVLDATGSMGPWIDEARARIKAIAADLAAGDPQPDVRFALVSYRDRGDAYVTRVHPFDRDLGAMRAALDATRAQGGGDTPEAVLEALAVGIDGLKWSDTPGTVKLLYLVGDARPQHYPDGPDEQTLLTLALERGIVIHTIACGRMSTSGQAFFEQMARFSEGRPFRLADGVKVGAGPTAAGAAAAGSLRAAVSGTARAYTGAAGVTFAGVPVKVTALPTSPTPASGLMGAHLRVVADAATWADLWRAHVGAEDAPPTPPAVDFAAQQVLATGGADAGLELVGLAESDGVRVATVRPAAPGVRFALVPAADAPVVVRDQTDKEGAL